MNNPTIHFMVAMKYLDSKRGRIKDNSPPQKISLVRFLAHDSTNIEFLMIREMG